VRVRPQPGLHSDNKAHCVSDELGRLFESPWTGRTYGTPFHPMTLGKGERCHHSMKNLIQLQTYAFSGDLARDTARFVEYPVPHPGTYLRTLPIVSMAQSR
jgi:hypothetical protein